MMNKALKRKQRSKSILMLLVYLTTLVLALTFTAVTMFEKYIHSHPRPDKPIPPIKLPNIDVPGGLLDKEYYDYDDGTDETLLYQHVIEYITDKGSHHNDQNMTFLLYETIIYAPWILESKDLESNTKNHGYDYSTVMEEPSSNGIFYQTVFVIDDELDIPKETKEINDCIIIAKKGILIQSDLSINKSLVLTSDLNTDDRSIKFEMNKTWIYSINPYFNGDILDNLVMKHSIVGTMDEYSKIHDGDKVKTNDPNNIVEDSYIDVV